ncbi:hypothetical protein KAR91_01600 [Candidatus Pacearchaeota archaeon]|nr:hypothetical protein [Candidatus Pacearchaeota archaeon]
MLEYTPSIVAIDRSKVYTADGNIPVGPAGAHQIILLDGSSNTVTATLPPAPYCVTQTYTIKCVDATFQCDFAVSGADKVDDSSANVVLSLYEAKTVRSDGLNWWVI